MRRLESMVKTSTSGTSRIDQRVRRGQTLSREICQVSLLQQRWLVHRLEEYGGDGEGAHDREVDEDGEVDRESGSSVSER